MRKGYEFQKAGDILKELFGHLNFQEGEAYVSFFSDWMDLVGVDLACHVRPLDIRQKSLLLEVDHPGWMQMFQLKQKRILHRIQKKHPSLGITSVRFRLKSSLEEDSHEGFNSQSPSLPRPSPSAAPSRPAPRTNELPPGAENNSPSPLSPKPIQDERLRRALEGLGKQIKKRRN